MEANHRSVDLLGGCAPAGIPRTPGQSRYISCCHEYNLCAWQCNSILMQTPRVSIRLHRSPTRPSPFEMPAISSGIPRSLIFMTEWLQVQEAPWLPLVLTIHLNDSQNLRKYYPYKYNFIKKNSNQLRQKKRYIGWHLQLLWTPSFHALPHGIRVHHLPRTLMCSPARKLNQASVTRDFIGILLCSHDWWSHWPRDWT